MRLLYFATSFASGKSKGFSTLARQSLLEPLP